MNQASHFIEQLKYADGLVKHSGITKITLLQWSFEKNKKFGIETIAVFKIKKHAGN